MPRSHTVVPDQAAVEQPVASSVAVSTPSEIAPREAPGADAPLDIDGAWNGLPEPVRTGIAERLYGRFNQGLEEQYGDIVPLAREAMNDPDLRAALRTFASDKELRDFIKDGGTIDQLRSLQKDPSYREFLFRDATEAYKKYPQPNTPAADPMAPFASRIEQLEQKLNAEASERVFNGYVGQRRMEIEALKAAAPALAADQDLLTHIVTQAENNFKIVAANSGINVSQPDATWSAQAVRAGLRPPSYIDVYHQYERLTGKTPPPAAPSNATAPARPGRAAQAPRTRVESAQMSAEERRTKTIEQMKRRTQLTAVK